MRILLTLFFLSLLFSCQKEKPLFTKIDGSASGILFENTITVNDTLNALVSEFVYNGGGVAIADLNGDQQNDLFFTACQKDNSLYLNQGDFNFRETSKISGTEKPSNQYWSSGVTVLDLNLDGKQDIYVCNTLNGNAQYRRNFLYINKGNDKNGVPLFEEMAGAYGIADTSHASHAQFFDYDLDGDLDLFIGVNWVEEKFPHEFIEKRFGKEALNRDRLFRNDWDPQKGHPVFTDVSAEAGIQLDGYSHSTLIVDFNEDNYPDIYVANDFESDDLVYINNRNGTFTNQAANLFKHISLTAMGSDVGDVNNDGLADLFTTEMQPFYNKRKKLFQGESSYQREIFTKRFNYIHQFMRNTLQVNQGIQPQTGLPVFSEQGMFAGIHETDWSWAALFFDFDHDGLQDIFVSNGYPKDVTDHDFSLFRSYASRLVSTEDLLAAVPEVKSPNFLFKNKGNLLFDNITASAGMMIPSFSNGAAYGDLDNDGDLDLVVNNINDKAFLFKNNHNTESNNYIRLKLKGNHKNPDAIGASAIMYSKKHKQKQILLSGRGYLSQSELVFQFGLNQETTADSVEIVWPGGKSQKLYQLIGNQTHEIPYNENKLADKLSSPNYFPTIFEEKSADLGLDYQHIDKDFIDFNIQRTLPHKLSQYGPAIAIGDLDGDNREDFILSGSKNENQIIYYQLPDGTFEPQIYTFKRSPTGDEEDAGILIFDADGDGLNDLYFTRGCAQYPPNDPLYQDQLYLNQGNKKFTLQPNALPKITSNGSCVKAADIDLDGDLDLFVGSRSLPFSYPLSDRSYIFINEGKPGRPKFHDATERINKDLQFPGLITDALWTDFNNDLYTDLIIIGEWMSPRFFENKNGKLTEISTGMEPYTGWWNSICGVDLDNDGDTDYVLGNYGENLNMVASKKEPLTIYAKDIDQNGSIDPLISRYWPDSLGKRKEFLYHPLQDVMTQFSGIRKQFNSFGEYGEADVPELFSRVDMEKALKKQVVTMKSCWMENLGKGKFKLHILPMEAQMAPIYAIHPVDVNSDGFMDLIMVGNDFGIEVQQGKADALNGLALLNQRGKSFKTLPFTKSGFFVPGNGKSLAAININSNPHFLAGQNNGKLLAFGFKEKKPKTVIFQKNESYALVHLKNGMKRKTEKYFGHSFFSQSTNYLLVTNEISKIDFFGKEGKLQRTWKNNR
jgi:hypothetical protein